MTIFNQKSYETHLMCNKIKGFFFQFVILSVITKIDVFEYLPKVCCIRTTKRVIRSLLSRSIYTAQNI